MAYTSYVKGQIVWSSFLREMKGELVESEYIKRARSQAIRRFNLENERDQAVTPEKAAAPEIAPSRNKGLLKPRKPELAPPQEELVEV